MRERGRRGKRRLRWRAGFGLKGRGLGGGSKREAAAALAGKLGIDASVFGELLDIRERKKDRKAARVDEVFARYLKLVEQVTTAVDKMLEPAAEGGLRGGD